MTAAAAIGTQTITGRVTDALHDALRHERNPVKRLAIAADTNERTAKNWWEGRNAPGLAHFFRLAREIPELKSEALRLLEMEMAIDPEFQRDFMRLMQTMQRRARAGGE